MKLEFLYNLFTGFAVVFFLVKVKNMLVTPSTARGDEVVLNPVLN